MENFTIRAADINDAESIAKIHHRCWQETYKDILPATYLSKLPVRTAMWQQILSATQSGTLAEVMVSPENQIIGFVSAGKCRPGELITDGEIYALYLLKLYHNKGLGRRLFLQAVKKLYEAGNKSFCVYVMTLNPSIQFYRKFNADKEVQVKVTIDGVDYDETGLGWWDVERMLLK